MLFTLHFQHYFPAPFIYVIEAINHDFLARRVSSLDIKFEMKDKKLDLENFTGVGEEG